MSFANVYEDAARAGAYARLEFPGTYYLAYRDLPEIIGAHVVGRSALDVGCGAGRSTRFLKRLGFDAVGVDISAEMLAHARAADPEGAYVLVDASGLGPVEGRTFDLATAVFTFDNIPTLQQKAELFGQLRRLLTPDGRLVVLVSSPAIYTHEWASFTTAAFPENRDATTGDTVRIVMTDVEDRRPVEDVVCTGEAYRHLFAEAGLDVVDTRTPLGRNDEPFAWVSETRVAPWVIYVLAPGHQPAPPPPRN